MKICISSDILNYSRRSLQKFMLCTGVLAFYNALLAFFALFIYFTMNTCPELPHSRSVSVYLSRDYVDKREEARQAREER